MNAKMWIRPIGVASVIPVVVVPLYLSGSAHPILHSSRSPVRVTTAGYASDVTGAEDVFSRAAALLQTVGVPPNASLSQPTPSDIASMQTAGQSALGAIFGPTAINQGETRLNNSVAILQAGSIRILDGGVSNIQYDAVTPDTTGGFTIRAHVTAWAKLAQIHDGDAAIVTPTNILLVTATVEPINGADMVTSYDWSYAPGSEP